jgi:hypothetical protein
MKRLKLIEFYYYKKILQKNFFLMFHKTLRCKLYYINNNFLIKILKKKTGKLRVFLFL